MDIKQPHAFDRHSHLIAFWFELFSAPVSLLPNLTGKMRPRKSESKIDYKKMVGFQSSFRLFSIEWRLYFLFALLSKAIVHVGRVRSVRGLSTSTQRLKRAPNATHPATSANEIWLIQYVSM